MPALLNDGSPNLYTGLFRHRPHELRRPAEDFLTEALAYLIATHDGLHGPVVNALTGGLVTDGQVLEVSTQHTVAREDGTQCRPDMRLAGRDGAGKPFEIWFENKWTAPLREDQLATYRAELGRLSRRKTRHLVFVSSLYGDARYAAGLLQGRPAGVGGTALTWSELYEALGEDGGDGPLAHFRQFLLANALGPVQRVTLDDARNFQQRRQTKSARGQRVGRADDYRRQLQALCGVARDQSLAAKYGPGLELGDAWGRAWLYLDEDWKVSVGLLHDCGDHQTAFLDEEKPTDITVRVQANPTRQTREDLERSRNSLSALRDRLEKAGFDCDRGAWRANRHTILLGHYKPGFPWDFASGVEQARRVAEVFDAALGILTAPDARRLIERLPAY